MGLSLKLVSRCNSAEPVLISFVCFVVEKESDGMLSSQAGFGSLGQALLAEAWEFGKCVGLFPCLPCPMSCVTSQSQAEDMASARGLVPGVPGFPAEWSGPKDEKGG